MLFSKLFLAFLWLSVRWRIFTLFFPPFKFCYRKSEVTCSLGASANLPFRGAGSHATAELVLSRALDRVTVQIAGFGMSEHSRKEWFESCPANAMKMPDRSICESFSMIFSSVMGLYVFLFQVGEIVLHMDCNYFFY